MYLIIVHLRCNRHYSSHYENKTVMSKLAGNVTTQSVLKLKKSDISKAVNDKSCREEELEWKNNPYICRKKELGVNKLK